MKSSSNIYAPTIGKRKWSRDVLQIWLDDVDSTGDVAKLAFSGDTFDVIHMKSRRLKQRTHDALNDGADFTKFHNYSRQRMSSTQFD